MKIKNIIIVCALLVATCQPAKAISLFFAGFLTGAAGSATTIGTTRYTKNCLFSIASGLAVGYIANKITWHFTPMDKFDRADAIINRLLKHKLITKELVNAITEPKESEAFKNSPATIAATIKEIYKETENPFIAASEDIDEIIKDLQKAAALLDEIDQEDASFKELTQYPIKNSPGLKAGDFLGL